MALKLTELRTDHEGDPLPPGVYAAARDDGTIAGYKARWREEDDDGVRHNRAKFFSARKLGSLVRAREQAVTHRHAAVEIVERGDHVQRPDAAVRMTVGDLFKEWITDHAAPSLSERYATDAVRWWDREIAGRPIARVRLSRLADDPAIITRFQDELTASGLPAASRVQVLKILRSVLRWGRRRYARTLTIEFSGLFELPSQQRKRLIYAADPVAVERLIEAVLARPARNAVVPMRDAALIAAMGFTVAARPSEWLRSTTWADLYDNTVEFQRPDTRLTDLLEPSEDGLEAGLKTGARAALLFASARDRLHAYRTELEARYGAQPEHGLVFQRLGAHGPMWQKDGTPVVWSADDYKRWTARVWRPARQRAESARHRQRRRRHAVLRPQAHRHLHGAALDPGDDQTWNEPAQPRCMDGTRRPDAPAHVLAHHRPLPRSQADRPREGTCTCESTGRETAVHADRERAWPPAGRTAATARACCSRAALSSSRCPVFTRPSAGFRIATCATGRGTDGSGRGATSSANSHARRSAYRTRTPRPFPSRWATSLPEPYARRMVRTLRCAIRTASATVTKSSAWMEG
jgi:hypothetical protein